MALPHGAARPCRQSNKTRMLLMLVHHMLQAEPACGCSLQLKVAAGTGISAYIGRLALKSASINKGRCVAKLAFAGWRWSLPRRKMAAPALRFGRLRASLGRSAKRIDGLLDSSWLLQSAFYPFFILMKFGMHAASTFQVAINLYSDAISFCGSKLQEEPEAYRCYGVVCGGPFIPSWSHRLLQQWQTVCQIAFSWHP